MPFSLFFLLTWSGAANAGGAGPGRACAQNDDCIRGSHCDAGTCEFPGPCRAVTTSPDYPTSFSASTFDRRGRLVQTDTVAEDRLHERVLVKWTGQTQTWESFQGSSTVPAWIIETTVDRLGRRASLTQGPSADALTSRTDFTYATCGAVEFTWTDTATGDSGFRRVTCGDGYPLSAESWSRRAHGEQLDDRRTFVVENGRLTAMVLEIPAQDYKNRVTFVRSPEGYQIGERQDLGDDGTIDFDTTWDLDCWALARGRVVPVR